MEWLLNIPGILKILITLIVIIIMMNIRVPLSISLLSGGLFLSLFFEMPFTGYLKCVYYGIFSLDTFSLLLVIISILILSNMLSVSGRLTRIVESFKIIFGESRISLVTFPALIGLLPMPGGAIFSAPMVGAVSENSSLSNEEKSAINYWFRHIWEYWYPLYPGAILCLSLSKLPPWKFMAMNFPMTIFAVIAGYIVILRKTSLSDKKHRNYSGKNIKKFISEIIPILLVIASMFLLGPVFKWFNKFIKLDDMLADRLPVFIGITISLFWIIYFDKVKWIDVRKTLVKKSIWEMFFLVLGLMIFKKVLADSNAIINIKNDLLKYNIPVLALIAFLPFIGGMVTGIAVGFVGISYPIVTTIIASMNIPLENSGSLYFVAYLSGYAGMMLSPIHLCLLLTKDYFKAGMKGIYFRYLLPTVLLTFIPWALFYLLYRYLGI